MPVVQAKRIIADAKSKNNQDFGWIDNVVVTTNTNEISDVNQTTIVLTEIDSSPARMGNNSFQGWIFAIELQIYFQKNIPGSKSFNWLEAEMKLAKLFTNNGWVINRSDPHVTDPITNQTTKTFYFGKKI